MWFIGNVGYYICSCLVSNLQCDVFRTINMVFSNYYLLHLYDVIEGYAYISPDVTFEVAYVVSTGVGEFGT